MAEFPLGSQKLRGTVLSLATVSVVLVAGCGAGPDALPSAGLRCVDDSPHCVAQRTKTLNGYMADSSRSWVKQPAGPEAYASGVRLFAFSKRRKELSCDELRHGKREADAAPATLRGPAGSHLTPAQVSRGVMLASEVSRELAKEIRTRCG